MAYKQEGYRSNLKPGTTMTKPLPINGNKKGNGNGNGNGDEGETGNEPWPQMMHVPDVRVGIQNIKKVFTEEIPKLISEVKDYFTTSESKGVINPNIEVEKPNTPKPGSQTGYEEGSKEQIDAINRELDRR